MTPSNRAINTGHTPSDQRVTLEAIKDVKGYLNPGLPLKEGDTIEVSKGEAKRLLTQFKGELRIKVV